MWYNESTPKEKPVAGQTARAMRHKGGYSCLKTVYHVRGKKSPIILAGESFATKKSVSERARSILHRGVINDRDFSFLIDLFKNHDEWEEKQGSGIASIFVDSDKSITPGSWKRNKCFWLRRTDGSEVHISFVHCVTGIRGGKRNNVLSTYKLAARHAIWPQIVNFKRSTFGDSSCIVCPDSGKTCSL